jgi:hypothetical protein
VAPAAFVSCARPTGLVGAVPPGGHRIFEAGSMGVHFGPEGDRMARTVIQIAADPSYLYALCNDGEIFRLVNHVWQPMAPIPQDDPRDTGAKPKPGFIQIADEPGG